MAVNPIRFDEDRRRYPSREVAGDWRVRAFFPIRDVLQQSLSLDLKAFRTLSQRMVLQDPRGKLERLTRRAQLERRTGAALYNRQFDQTRSRSSLNSRLDL